jgi:hypothetical protein
VDPVAREVAEAMGLGVLDMALSDSVDFRLLFSAPQATATVLADGFRLNGWDLHEIGYLRDSSGVPRVVAIDTSGECEVPGIPWDQSDEATVDRLAHQK